ncbi:MAG: alpha-galactosidase, partial [Abditibacteriota bacterium]|nr:alpha-galactosidase [Abditibacteriota bacterium]
VILRRLALRRAPRSLLCLLWIPVALRLLLPIPLRSGFSLIPASVSRESVAAWTETRLYSLPAGSNLNELPPAADPAPFSFEYGGKASRELLAGWEYTCRDRELEDRTLRTACWRDPDTNLEIKAVVNIYKKTSGVDWTFYIANRGSGNTPVLSAFRALDACFYPAGADRSRTVYAAPGVPQQPDTASSSAPVLFRQEGSTGMAGFTHREFMPLEDILTDGDKIEFGTPGAYSSSGAFPFYNLSFGNYGIVTALGWTGQWDAEVENRGGKIRSSAGMTKLNCYLEPGESIRSPRVLLTLWKGLPEDGWNYFRHTMLEYIVPRSGGEIIREPVFDMCSCFNEANDTTFENEKTYIDNIVKHRLPFEVYWLDAWWHKGGFPAGLGNYGYPPERAVAMDRFPEGVKGISDYAHKNGLRVMCWFAPEALSEGCLLAREHPEWVLPAGASSGCFNLGIPEACDFMAGIMNTCIKEWGVDIWRTDIGYSLDGIRKREEKTPDRVGILEARQVEGLYRLWDSIIEANPGLFIDNCCGGGGRIDLETCSRSIPVWRTDSGNFTAAARNMKDMAIQNQDINSNLNLFVPQNTGQTFGTEPYYIRSAFNGGFLFGEDNRGEDYDNKALGTALKEVKRLQKYIFGDFYRLVFKGEASDEWCVYQYNRPEEGDGAVFAFRRDDSPILSMELSPRGIDPDKKYAVTVYGESYRPSRRLTMKGRDLARLKVEIPRAPASALIEYRASD